MGPSEGYVVQDDIVTPTTEDEPVTMETEDDVMAAETCLRLLGYNEDVIDCFVREYDAREVASGVAIECNGGDEATTQIQPVIQQVLVDFQLEVQLVIAPSTEDRTTTSIGLSFPTQVSQPEWMHEATTNIGVQINPIEEEVCLSMPFPPHVDPAEVIHYFTNARNWQEHSDGQSEDDNAISEEEAEFVPCTPHDGSQTTRPISKFLKLPV